MKSIGAEKILSTGHQPQKGGFSFLNTLAGRDVSLQPGRLASDVARPEIIRRDIRAYLLNLSLNGVDVTVDGHEADHCVGSVLTDGNCFEASARHSQRHRCGLTFQFTAEGLGSAVDVQRRDQCSICKSDSGNGALPPMATLNPALDTRQEDCDEYRKHRAHTLKPRRIHLLRAHPLLHFAAHQPSLLGAEAITTPTAEGAAQ